MVNEASLALSYPIVFSRIPRLGCFAAMVSMVAITALLQYPRSAEFLTRYVVTPLREGVVSAASYLSHMILIKRRSLLIAKEELKFLIRDAVYSLNRADRELAAMEGEVIRQVRSRLFDIRKKLHTVLMELGEAPPTLQTYANLPAYGCVNHLWALFNNIEVRIAAALRCKHVEAFKTPFEILKSVHQEISA